MCDKTNSNLQEIEDYITQYLDSKRIEVHPAKICSLLISLGVRTALLSAPNTLEAMKCINDSISIGIQAFESCIE